MTQTLTEACKRRCGGPCGPCTAETAAPMLLSNTPPVARRLARKNWTLASTMLPRRKGWGEPVHCHVAPGWPGHTAERKTEHLKLHKWEHARETSYLTFAAPPAWYCRAGASTGHLSGRSTNLLRKSRTEGMNRKAHSAKWDGPSQGGTAFQIASCEALRAQEKEGPPRSSPRGQFKGKLATS